MQLQSPLTLVTAALDGHVLTVLTRVDAWLTTPQIRASLSSFSDEGIRKVLRRLVEQGIVEAETVDARVLDMTESEVRHFGRDEPVVADIVAARHARFAGPPRWLGAPVG